MNLNKYIMKRLLFLLSIIAIIAFQSCTGPAGPPGRDGQDGQPGLLSEVFELRNVNFFLDKNNGYTIYQKLTPKIFDSDVILIYRLTGTIDANTPIWQQIPRTLFIKDVGELDYDFDFSKEDFTIYAGGTYNLATTPQFINGQTFRIVIVPGAFSNKSSKKIDYSNYNEVIKTLGIDDSRVKLLN
jgi:hypothetical protein